MKWIDNLIYTLLSACLLAGCEDSGSKELERMQGYWVHVRGHPAFTLSKRAADTPSPGKRMSGAEYWKRLTR